METSTGIQPYSSNQPTLIFFVLRMAKKLAGCFVSKEMILLARVPGPGLWTWVSTAQTPSRLSEFSFDAQIYLLSFTWMLLKTAERGALNG